MNPGYPFNLPRGIHYGQTAEAVVELRRKSIQRQYSGRSTPTRTGYPYEDFKNDMSSAKSQASLAEQYELAKKAGTLVVFVRDNEAKRLASYSMDYK